VSEQYTFPNTCRNTVRVIQYIHWRCLRTEGHVTWAVFSFRSQHCEVKLIWSCKSSMQYHAYSFSGTEPKNRVKVTARQTLNFIVQQNSMQRFSWTESDRNTAARNARNAGRSYVLACGKTSWLLHLPVLGNQRHTIICQYNVFFLIIYKGTIILYFLVSFNKSRQENPAP
jgi:hypothetical protein